MLKLLYKTLLISVLSCSLMILNFNSTGLNFQAAQAETVKTEGIKDGDMMATLTMVGVGILTSRLFMCKMTTDMMVAAVAGVVYLGGEVLATMKLRKVMKDLETEITRDSKGNINDEQIKDLERLKKSYQEAKKTAKMKKMLQMAAAAAFVAAAVLAYTQNAAVKAAVAQCTTALTTAAGAACAAGIVTAPAAPIAAAVGVEEVAIEAHAEVPEPSAPQAAAEEASSLAARAKHKTADFCPAAMAAEVPCAAGYVIKKVTRGVCLVPPVVVSNDSILPTILGKQLYSRALLYTPAYPSTNIFTKIQQALVPDAKADLFSPMGIAGVAAIAYVTLVSKTIGVQLDMMLFSPMKRAIAYGVLGALVFMASKSTDSQVKKLDANIKKIDDILKGLNTLALGTGTTQVASGVSPNGGTSSAAQKTTNLNMDGTTYEPIDLNKDGQGALPCFTGNADNGNCKSFEQVAKDLPSYAGLNLESQKQIDGLMKVGDGFNGKSNITSGALNSAAQLAGSANALNSNAEAAKKKLIAALKASGSKIDPDAMSKKFADDMEKSVRAALQKSGSTPSGMMASLYGGSGSKLGSSEDAAKLAAEKAAADAAAKKEAASGGNVYDMQAGTAPGASDSGLTGLNSGKASGDNAASQSSGLLSSADALKSLELDHNDISTDANANLFELISNRYQQSGFRRLFKLKEAPEEAPVTK